MPNTKEPTKPKETKQMTPNPEPPMVSMPRAARQDVIAQDQEFPLLKTPEAMGRIIRLIDENLGGQKFNVLNLPRIKMSKETGLFQIELAGGMETERNLFCVITAFRPARIYWGRAYNPAQGKQPPACTSMDGFVGVGDPGGNCAECPWAQFKSARNPDGSQAAGQACKELRQMLVLLPGQMLPHRLDVPPTSLQGFTKYSLNLVYSGDAYWGVVTKLGLEIVPSGGYPVARVLFSRHKQLDPDETQILAPYHERMYGYLRPAAVEAEAYEIDDERPGGPRNPDDVPF